MTIPIILLASVVFAAPLADVRGVIEGVVVDGSANDTSLAGVEVVLCVDDKGERIPVETKKSGPDGQFTFDNLPLGDGIVYFTGVNRNSVHYPGERVPFDATTRVARVRLVCYDSIASPCPLVVRNHEIRVRSEKGALYVNELLQIDNPTTKTFIGQSLSEMPPVTLRLSIPGDFDKVTFQQEFYGRQFMVLDGRVLTSIPWPPGERTLEFTYLLPIDKPFRTLQRRLDLPTDRLVIHVKGSVQRRAGDVTLQLANVKTEEAIFVSRQSVLPVAHLIELELGQLPVPVMAYGKWGALMILVAGIAISRRLLSPARCA